MKEILTTAQARKLVLLSQHLYGKRIDLEKQQATLHAIEHLGYIQIDTISAVQRAHHHTLWNRNRLYKPHHLDSLLSQQKIFEYWSHAASYLPMLHYRFTLPRKIAIATGTLDHWYKRDKRLMENVLERIRDEGPLMAKDFKEDKNKRGDWGAKPAKQALENLYMQGDLMISGRKNFHKVYDLTERVLPDSVDTRVPTQEEYIRFLIHTYLKAQGIGKAGEIAYLLKGMKKPVQQCINDQVEKGELIEIETCNNNYVALSSTLSLLQEKGVRKGTKILSPFDNILINRRRTKELFDFDYQLECYMSESKRTYGYFALPVIFDGNFVARIDCKADRKNSLFTINHFSIESTLKKREDFFHSFAKELTQFLQFNECSHLQLHPSLSSPLKEELSYHLEDVARV